MQYVAATGLCPRLACGSGLPGLVGPVVPRLIVSDRMSTSYGVIRCQPFDLDSQDGMVSPWKYEGCRWPIFRSATKTAGWFK